MRRLLFAVALAALPACSSNSNKCQLLNTANQSGCSNGCPSGHVDATLEENTAAPPILLRIESCRVDVDACPDLCSAVMQQQAITTPSTKCDVTFDSQHAYVSIEYAGCAVFNAGMGGGGPQ